MLCYNEFAGKVLIVLSASVLAPKRGHLTNGKLQMETSAILLLPSLWSMLPKDLHGGTTQRDLILSSKSTKV